MRKAFKDRDKLGGWICNLVVMSSDQDYKEKIHAWKLACFFQV